MKMIYPLVFGAICVLMSSCMTQDMIAKAQGRPGPMDPPNRPPTQPNPAYYALVPLVLPLDLAFFPFEFIYMQNNQPQSAPPGPSGPPQSGYYGEPYRPSGYTRDNPPPAVMWQE